MYCPICGTQLPDDASFCGSCGARLQTPSQDIPASPSGYGAPQGTPDAALPPYDAPQNSYAQNVSQTPYAQNPLQRFPQAPPVSPGVQNGGQADQQAPMTPVLQQNYAPTAYATPADKTAAATTKVQSIGVLHIAAGAAGLLTVIFLWLKWMSVPLLKTVGSVAKALGLSGTEDAYGVIGFANFMKSISNMTGNATAQMLGILFLLIWIVVLVLLVAGILVMLFGKKHNPVPLIVAAVVAVLFAVAWCIFISVVNMTLVSQLKSYIGASTTACVITSMPVWTIVMSIVTIVLSVLSKKRAR